MSYLRLTRVVAAATIVGSSLLVMSPAQAYSPGTATAHKATYNANTGARDWSCSFAHWRSSAKVTYSCSLEVRYFSIEGDWTNKLVVKHSGSWTPPPSSHSTSTWHEKGYIDQLCVVARALSVDGGVTKTVCD